jgi:undecaprenyl phosphate N,N'-diacetylbacillosamine 1-phosphate transferase
VSHFDSDSDICFAIIAAVPAARICLPVVAMTKQRLFDLVIAVPMLFVAAPFLGLLLLLIRTESSGSAIFMQTRVGRRGRPFTLYKLRTFYSHAHGLLPGEVWPGDPRVTWVGAFLRRSKLDELPQLVNVLLGHMSLVGPRPDIPVQVADYEERQRERLAVKPGLSGLAQISGNIHLTWTERIELDRWYVEHRSLRLDLAILLYTVPMLWRGERRGDDPLGIRSRVLGQPSLRNG